MILLSRIHLSHAKLIRKTNIISTNSSIFSKKIFFSLEKKNAYAHLSSANFPEEPKTQNSGASSPLLLRIINDQATSGIYTESNKPPSSPPPMFCSSYRDFEWFARHENDQEGVREPMQPKRDGGSIIVRCLICLLYTGLLSGTRGSMVPYGVHRGEQRGALVNATHVVTSRRPLSKHAAAQPRFRFVERWTPHGEH